MTRPTDAQAAFQFPCGTSPSTQNIGLNSDAFGKQFSYKSGQVLTTNWLKSNSGGTANSSIGWLSFDVDRDDADGAVTTSRDTSGVATPRRHDGLGPVTDAAGNVRLDDPNVKK